MITLYIVLGILGWLICSLGATWFFTYCFGILSRNGINDIAGYTLFIIGWPFIFIVTIFTVGMEFLYENLEKFSWMNPLRIWDIVAMHGAKRGKQ